jgi:hypothetical protein
VTTLSNDIETSFGDNTIGSITPAILRKIMHETAAIGGAMTRAECIATTFVNPPEMIRTSGYSNPADGGGALYVKVNAAPTAHPAWFQTLDGTYYLLVPEHCQLLLPQFGAKQMVNHLVQPSAGAVDDVYPAWLAADKFIASYVSGSVTPGGFALRLPPGIWFTSKAIHLKRKTYDIDGTGMKGTYLRFPAYCDGIITAYTWSCGHDYSVFGPSAPVIAGMAVWKTDLQLSPGNVYRCITGGILAASGDPLTGSDPTATYTHGTAQFKYETNVGPSSAYDYDITSTNYAENSGISNLVLWSFWDPRTSDPLTNKWPDQNLDLAGQPIFNCAINMRARARVKNVTILSSNGFGIAIIANGDRDMKGAGNTNGWDLEHIIVTGCGKDNIHVGDSDSNAGSARFIDSSYAGRMGVADFSFLGDNWTDVQSAYDGSANSPFRQYVGGTLYNGYGWRARLPALGVELWPNYIGEEPGAPNPAGPTIPWIRYFGTGNDGIAAKITGSITSNTLTVTAVASGALAIGQMIASAESVTSGRVRPGTKITGGSGTTWTVDGAAQTVAGGPINAMSLASAGGSEYPDWTPTKRFEPCGAWGSNNYNARNRWSGMYIEGGTMPAQPGPRDTVIGGLMQGDVDRTRGALIVDDNAWTYLSAFGLWTSPNGAGNYSSRVTLGGNGDTKATVLAWNDYQNASYALRHANGTGTDGIAGADVVLDDITGGGNTNIFTIAGHNTTRTFGGAGGNTLPGAFMPKTLIMPDGAGDGRPLGTLYSVPTSGYYRAGHVLFNNGGVSLASGQPWGWICTASGSPGTWKILGTVP